MANVAAVLGATASLVLACTPKNNVAADGALDGATTNVSATKGSVRPYGAAQAPRTVDAGAAEPRAIAFCKSLHARAAERKQSCCHEVAASAILETDCTARLSDAIRRGNVEIDEAVADACAAAANQVTQGCGWVTHNAPTTPEACRGALRGLGKAGGACRSSVECEAGLHCAGGACQAPLAAGAPCGTFVDALASVTGQLNADVVHPVCAESCNRVTHKCEAKPTVGAKCFTHAGCAAGQVCLDQACALGTPPAAGESCKKMQCSDGLYCREGTCRARVHTGEACQSDFDCAEGGCVTVSGRKVCGMQCGL